MESEEKMDAITPKGITSYIIERYHNDLRKRLPELYELAVNVERANASSDHLPIGLSEFIREIGHELFAHMDKEEEILFPLINKQQSNFVKAPIARMEFEHDQHAKNLRRLREVTNNYTPPKDAPESWIQLYKAFEEFEKELLEHVNLENNTLFPLALNALIP